MLRELKNKLFIFFIAPFIFSNELPEGFVYIDSIIPDISIDLKYYSKNNFVGERITGYKEPVLIATKEVAYALREVQKDLSHFNYGLRIFDCYRPQRAVDHFAKWARNNDRKMKKTHYPDVKKKNLFKEGYIASKSGHSRGSTVDLTIIDFDSGNELDMGTIYDFFGKQSWIENEQLDHKQKQNRHLLQSVMKKYGFKPLEEEWWHFTLSNEPFPDKYFNFVVE